MLQAGAKKSKGEQLMSVKEELRMATELMAAASSRVEQVGAAQHELLLTLAGLVLC